MKKIKATLICTIFNEGANIQELLDSVIAQSEKPDEIIIVDGGSTDNTLSIIKNWIGKHSTRLSVKLYVKKGNRSVGRNEAIKRSSHDLILCTDSGCLLDKDWILNIKKPFENKNVDVVAGFYDGKPQSIFQKCLIPYVLVMKDKVNKDEFLPATRSMAFKKQVWEKLKGFNEKLSHNEDYDFANRIKKNNFSTYFSKKAIVHWIPRKNIFEAFKMFFRFSLGDIEANLVRDKVVYLFLRYLFAIYLVILSAIMKSIQLHVFDLLLLFSYLVWSIYKNYKYVKDIRAFAYLPLLQFTSDIAIILGTSIGVIKKFSRSRLRELVLNNKSLILIILSYVFILLSTIGFGIPNLNHPFNYFMDEWHQSQSVRYLFTLGSPNLPGAANGSIFQFFLTGIYLVPFYILGILNPFLIKSSVLNLDIQHRLFEILRFNTILWGVLSITTFYYIVKKYFKINPVVTTFLFVFNPLWITLSNFFKYDIALMFWMLLSFLFMLKYVQNHTLLNAILIGLFSAISLSVKIEPFSLLLCFILVFLFFTPKPKKNIKNLFWGIVIYIMTFIFLGIPDIILGKGNLHEYLVSNLSQTPEITSHYFNLGSGYFQYFLLNLYPVTFGRVLYFTFILSLIFGIAYLFYVFVSSRRRFTKVVKKNKLLILLLVNLFVYTASLYPLKLGAVSNRLIPFLIFIPITAVYFWEYVYVNLNHSMSRQLFFIIVALFIAFQFVETYSWVLLKKSPNPREVSSKWIQSNIKNESNIGIENIPIYQFLPDIVQKEYYLKQYEKDVDNKYKYQVIDKNSKKFPELVIVSNDYVESKYTYNSDKKILLQNLKKNEYRILKTFYLKNYIYSIFNNRLDYFMSSLVQLPDTITIYEQK